MPQTDHAEERWLAGTIGKENGVRVYLLRHGDRWTGAYYYVRWWKPIWIEGSGTDRGIIHLTEFVDSEKTGTLDLRIGAGDRVTGTWTSPDGRRTASVELQKIPRIPCDGEGPWTTYSEPSWPVSFDYPADWKVRIDGDALTVVCPDPASMAMGSSGAVRLTRGRGDDSLEEQGPFAKVGGQWSYSDTETWGWCRESPGSCAVPAITTREAMTVLEASTLTGCHCLGNGGRLGLCSVEAFVFLLDREGWVSMLSYPGAYDISSRLAGSVRPSKASGGVRVRDD